MRQRARDPESTNQELSRKERVRQLQRETLRCLLTWESTGGMRWV